MWVWLGQFAVFWVVLTGLFMVYDWCIRLILAIPAVGPNIGTSNRPVTIWNLVGVTIEAVIPLIVAIFMDYLFHEGNGMLVLIGAGILWARRRWIGIIVYFAFVFALGFGIHAS